MQSKSLMLLLTKKKKREEFAGVCVCVCVCVFVCVDFLWGLRRRLRLGRSAGRVIAGRRSGRSTAANKRVRRSFHRFVTVNNRVEIPLCSCHTNNNKKKRKVKNINKQHVGTWHLFVLCGTVWRRRRLSTNDLFSRRSRENVWDRRQTKRCHVIKFKKFKWERWTDQPSSMSGGPWWSCPLPAMSGDIML